MEELNKEKRILEAKIKDAIESFVESTNKTPITTIDIDELKTKCSGESPIRIVSVNVKVLI